MNELAVRIEHVSKLYRLGVINTGTFYRDVQAMIAKKRGKPNPHAKLGSDAFEENDSFWALKDINLDIQKGDRIGIIGKNGAGKSTLLKLISRISAPTEGCIKINGKVASLLEVGTGFHKELTGRENIYLNGSILGMKKKVIDRRMDQIIEFSGIDKHIDTPVKRYSSGMYVRLGFAVAAHLDSQILIADEVLAVGDVKFQQKAVGKMSDISKEEGRTILFVSHNMQAVQALCNKGIVLERGRLAYAGDIAGCIAHYNKQSDSGDQRCWEGNNGDSNLRVFKASLEDCPEGFLLSIHYEVLMPDLDYVFSVQLFNTAGTQLCSSTASDFFDDEDYKDLKSKGRHILRLEIKNDILASGNYYLELDFAIHNLKRISDSSIRLYFEVYSRKFHRHPAPSRENILEPDWVWTK